MQGREREIGKKNGMPTVCQRNGPYRRHVRENPLRSSFSFAQAGKYMFWGEKLSSYSIE